MRQEPTALRWCRKCGRCEKSKENDCGITADEAGAYWNENITRRGLPEGIMTIWFNAWKYDREESLWSALALEILRKIRQQSTILGRWKMAIDLNRARFDWEQLLYERLPKELLLGVTVLIIAFFASIINLYWTSHLFPEVLSNSIKGIGLPWFFLVLIAIVLTTFWDFYKRLVGPFDLNISQYIHEPNYRERIGFLSQFEDDFRNVIDIHASSVKTTIPP